ncbi:hypothetical protein [Scopulibacillus cellulosilyticus]|uniref:Uncharacterized protein n=1 Tax=Scopulibacillus cellulosilyticus TaxID=2665665 RepID=A0ABW2PTZ3_9BACL
MYAVLTVLIILVGVIALFSTLLVGKEVNTTIKKLEETVSQEEHDKLLKEHYFKSKRVNILVLIFIYAATFLLAIIAMVIYIVNR